MRFIEQIPHPLEKIFSVRKKMVLQKRKGMAPGLIDDVLDALVCGESCKALDEAQRCVSKCIWCLLTEEYISKKTG